MILPTTLSLIYGTAVIAYVLISKKKMKKLIPILGFISLTLMVLTISLLIFIDSDLLMVTLISSFCAFCVLMPINSFLISKDNYDSDYN